jgi:hypothetical protein
VWKAPIKGGLASAARVRLPEDCALSQMSKGLEGQNVVSRGKAVCVQALAGRSVGLDGLDATFTDALVRIALSSGTS